MGRKNRLTPVVPSNYSHVPPNILEKARQRGSAVHKATELYDLGTLNWATLQPEVLPYLEAWIKFRDLLHGAFIDIERRGHVKLTAIVFHASCRIRFEKQDIEMLMRLSARHYDGHCREVGQVGGFLYGLNNVYVVVEPLAIAASGAQSEGTVTLNFREIDTLCKILEIGHAIHSDEQSPDFYPSMTLSDELRYCLHKLNNVCGLTQEV